APEQSGSAAAEDPCPICLDTMRNAACVPVCFHRFCFGCIRRWASRTATCPLCRHLCSPPEEAWGSWWTPSCASSMPLCQRKFTVSQAAWGGWSECRSRDVILPSTQH
uniref:RING-type E3 ubiquitin transferase n=1 Tax=Aquila chrysaetos chrysaetos TaxID=223781 RepID=A0A663FG43_AQUCH